MINKDRKLLIFLIFCLLAFDTMALDIITKDYAKPSEIEHIKKLHKIIQKELKAKSIKLINNVHYPSCVYYRGVSKDEALEVLLDTYDNFYKWFKSKNNKVFVEYQEYIDKSAKKRINKVKYQKLMNNKYNKKYQKQLGSYNDYIASVEYRIIVREGEIDGNQEAYYEYTKMQGRWKLNNIFDGANFQDGCYWK